MFRFLSGIVLVQLITTGLVITAFNWSDDLQLIIIIGFFALVVAFLTAFWFVSIANDIHKDEMVRMRQDHARDREQILVSTEREKAAIVTQSFQQIEKQTKRTYAKANFKIGVALAACRGIPEKLITAAKISQFRLGRNIKSRYPKQDSYNCITPYRTSARSLSLWCCGSVRTWDSSGGNIGKIPPHFSAFIASSIN